MDIKTYEELIVKFRDRGDAQAKMKRVEYTESRGDHDVLENFKATGKDLNLDPLQVLGIFMKKHWSSIINYIKTGRTYSSEKIDGRIMDLIQYLELTYACIEEKRMKDKDIDEKLVSMFDGDLDEKVHFTFKEKES